jgi:hypothetical protein
MKRAPGRNGCAPRALQAGHGPAWRHGKLWLAGAMACGALGLGCEHETVLVGVTFEIDAHEAQVNSSSVTKGDIDDLNLTSWITPDYIVIPTGLAIAVHITGQYVKIDKDKSDSESDLRDAESVEAPDGEVLTVTSADSKVCGVRNVYSQDEADTRPRWVLYGVTEGDGWLTIEGSETLGTVTVPTVVVNQ